MNYVIKIGIPALMALLVIGLLVWFFIFRSSNTEPGPVTEGTEFQADFTQNVNVNSPLTDSSASDDVPIAEDSISIGSSGNAIFKIANGPIAGATVIQTLRPTTTIARYIQQNNGHVFDIMLDSSGAVPRSISNTTIPGIVRTLWAEGGNAAIVQYIDASITKTVYLGFPAGQSTTTRPVIIKFFPEGIQDIAVSPNGTSVSYLLKTATGVAGYTAKSDGTGSKQVFTIPLGEILISWPAQNTILAQSKSAVGAPGIAFSVNVSSGAVLPLLYAPGGLTLTANPGFTQLVFQANDSTYTRDVATGKGTRLSFDPLPEKCIWGIATTTYLYCAVPVGYSDASYLDMWHQGVNSASDSILLFDTATGQSLVISAPGSEDEGGVKSAIHSMTLSKDEKYLLFIRRGDYSLWGVRAD